MKTGAPYGEVALGVESALPIRGCVVQPRRGIDQWLAWLMTALRRWG